MAKNQLLSETIKILFLFFVEKYFLNLDNLSIGYIGGIEDLVYLKEIKDNRIYFYTDIYKSTEKKLTLYEQI